MYMTTIDNRPQLVSRLRGHIVEVPEEARAASGIVINGRRIKTLMFTTDIAIIRNCDADAVLAVYPFTPQQTISDAIIQSASIPVFCGVGGGTTQGTRTAMLAWNVEAQGAMAALLKDAVNPNLVQTVEGTPAIMHGGPFANIAHGCNSVRATRTALKLADITITEAGFGSDLGAEKFLDIKCPTAGIAPSCIVLVATVRALKYNGGVPKNKVAEPDLAALQKGIVNLAAHLNNMQKYGVPVVVAINRFPQDTQEELDFIAAYCREQGAEFALSEVFAKGAEGGVELAKKVVEAVEKPSSFRSIVAGCGSIKERLDTIAKTIYGAKEVLYTPAAQKALGDILALDPEMDQKPVCVAKTQYSLSDDPAKLGRPTDFAITVRDVRLSNGAGFVVALTGDIMTMPGLPKAPAAQAIDVDEKGDIWGLF